MATSTKKLPPAGDQTQQQPSQFFRIKTIVMMLVMDSKFPVPAMGLLFVAEILVNMFVIFKIKCK